MFLKVANDLQTRPDLTFAMIEATKNEVYNELTCEIPSVSLAGYPQVLLYKPNEKDKPIHFHSEKTEQNMIKFIDHYLKSEHQDL
jgi:hypothetical protein